MAQENISELAYLVCDLGSLVGILRSTNHGTVTANDEHEATVEDQAPGLNVPPFGTCTAAGTCNFVPFGGWTNWVESTSGNNHQVLSLDSRLPCTNGGEIQPFNSAEALQTALADRPEVSLGVANRMAAMGGLPEVAAADFWMSNPSLWEHMTSGLGFAQTAMGTPIGTVYNGDENQGDMFDLATGFTESPWGTAFSSYGILSSTPTPQELSKHFRLKRAYRESVRKFEQRRALIGPLLKDANRRDLAYFKATGRHWGMHHRGLYNSLDDTAKYTAWREAWMAKRRLEINKVDISKPLPPRPEPPPKPIGYGLGKYRAVRWGGKVLGPVGIALDGFEAYDRHRRGDVAGSRRSMVKMVAGGLMWSKNPYAMVAGAFIYGGILFHEEATPRIISYLSNVQDELSIRTEGALRVRLQP